MNTGVTLNYTNTLSAHTNSMPFMPHPDSVRSTRHTNVKPYQRTHPISLHMHAQTHTSSFLNLSALRAPLRIKQAFRGESFPIH